MTYRATQDKVRDFEQTREDAARLAACLNSFDDSDSWPGGFTRGNPFTTERVLDDWSKSNSLRVLVAYSEDKIVGHCNVADAELDPEAAYVGLLGVDPAFQGQGFGKNLLIEAAQTAARAGKRRIDLHTWGGNLKAVPLYKRTGYNWVPGTSVLMESHIPGIIGASLFQKFFERYDWYDALKVDIQQATDDIVEKDIGIFKYRFEGENGDRLLVTVDREAKGINSFDMTLDGNRLTVSAKPAGHTGYIGLGSTAVSIEIANNLGEDLEYSISPSPADSVQFTLEGAGKGTIPRGSTVSERGELSIDLDATPLDRESNAWEKARTQVELVLRLGTDKMSLFCGVIPTEPIAITTGPIVPLLTPGEAIDLDVGFTNKSEEALACQVRITPTPASVCDKSEFSFELKPSKAEVFQVQVDAAEVPDPSVITLKAEVYVKDEGSLTLVHQKPLNIPLIGASGAVAYEGNENNIWLENEEFRISINKNTPMGLRTLHHKTLDLSHDVWGLLPDIGYPFADEGNEWDRKQFDTVINNENDYAEVVLSGDSIDRPGLHVTSTLRMHRGKGGLEQRIILTNKGTQDISNLGYMVRGWFSFVTNRFYVPLRGKLYCLDSLDWPGGRQLSVNPEDYSENWVASIEQDERVVVGYVWSTKYLEKIHRVQRGGLVRPEYKLPDLKPGDTIEFSPIRMIFTEGNWQKIRAIWQRINGSECKSEIDLDVRSDLEFEIVPRGTTHLRKQVSPVLLDRAKMNRMEFRLRVIHENPIKGTVSIRMPRGIVIDGESKVSFPIESVDVKTPFSKDLQIDASAAKEWHVGGGEIRIQFESRNIRVPLTAVIYDSDLEPKHDEESIEEFTVQSTSAGDYQMLTSAEHRAGMIRFNQVGEDSLFFDTFPKVEPFVWWDQFHSGISPFMLGQGSWDWEQAFAKERWKLTKVSKGPWIGYTAKMKSKHIPNARGVQLEVRYLMLLGTPLVNIRVRATNKAKVWRRVMFGIRGALRPDTKMQRVVHTRIDGEPTTYYSTGNGTSIFTSTMDSWGAIEGLRKGKTLGLISTERTQPSLTLNIQSENKQTIGIRKWSTLRPGASDMVNGYVVLADSKTQVTNLRGLPTRIS